MGIKMDASENEYILYDCRDTSKIYAYQEKVLILKCTSIVCISKYIPIVFSSRSYTIGMYTVERHYNTSIQYT